MENLKKKKKKKSFAHLITYFLFNLLIINLTIIKLLIDL